MSNTPRVILFIGFCLILSIFLIPAISSQPLHENSLNVTTVTSFSSDPSPHVQIYSSLPGSSDLLYVPLNSTGVPTYPVWHIYLYGVGPFQLSVNGNVVESGQSLGAFNFTYSWTNQYANATLKFNGEYTFHDTISGLLSDHNIQSVSVTSFCKGQDQYLTVANGVSGALMYPRWTVLMQSTSNVSYTVFVNGQQIDSGSFVGQKAVALNISGSTVSVIIGVGKQVYKYPHELVSSIPIQKYYGPKPPPALYTYYQYEEAIVKGFVASIFGVAIAMFSGRRYILEKEKREAIFI